MAVSIFLTEIVNGNFKHRIVGRQEMAYTSWSIEKIIVLSLLCLGISMMLVGYFLPTRNVVPRQGTFTLRPGRGAIILTCGFFLETVAVLYLMTQSYKGQEIAASLMGFIFLFMCLYLAYSFFMCHYSFDAFQISRKAWGRKTRIIPWSDLVRFAIGWDGSYWKLVFNNDLVLNFQHLWNGVNQLKNWALTHVQGLTSFKLFAESKGDYFKSLVGTLLVIRIFYVNENLEIGKVLQIFGMVETVNLDHLLVMLGSDREGEYFKLPTNAEAFREVDEEDDISSLQEDDHEGTIIISEWYTTDSSWA